MLNRKPTDPLLNLRICQALNQMYAATPEINIRSVWPEVISPDENMDFRALDSVCPPAIWIATGDSMLVLVGGTSGQIHVPQLLAGWSNLSANWEQSYGASSAFYNAARTLLDAIGPAELGPISKFYLCGHSYGGAVVEAMAAILRGAGNPETRVWSYGAPRAGLFRLGTFLASVTNTRWFTDDDPVRFIPPHTSEVPSLTVFENWDLIRGCNQQVQPPLGWQLESDGRFVESEGNPTVLHAVALSIGQWCADISGFRSVNHALQNYINRFTLAYNTVNPVEVLSLSRPREEPEMLTIRQRERYVDHGEADIQNALARLPNFNSVYAVPAIPPDSPLRYRRRRVGRMWGVKLGDMVVAGGLNKRQALKTARGFNKAAVRT
jgi:pimeloyl-ACP methyl ester carboxylesterase